MAIETTTTETGTPEVTTSNVDPVEPITPAAPASTVPTELANAWAQATGKSWDESQATYAKMNSSQRDSAFAADINRLQSFVTGAVKGINGTYVDNTLTAKVFWNTQLDFNKNDNEIYNLIYKFVSNSLPTGSKWEYWGATPQVSGIVTDADFDSRNLIPTTPAELALISTPKADAISVGIDDFKYESLIRTSELVDRPFYSDLSKLQGFLGQSVSESFEANKYVMFDKFMFDLQEEMGLVPQQIVSTATDFQTAIVDVSTKLSNLCWKNSFYNADSACKTCRSAITSDFQLMYGPEMNIAFQLLVKAVTFHPEYLSDNVRKAASTILNILGDMANVYVIPTEERYIADRSNLDVIANGNRPLSVHTGTNTYGYLGGDLPDKGYSPYINPGEIYLFEQNEVAGIRINYQIPKLQSEAFYLFAQVKLYQQLLKLGWHTVAQGVYGGGRMLLPWTKAAHITAPGFLNSDALNYN